MARVDRDHHGFGRRGYGLYNYGLDCPYYDTYTPPYYCTY
jgi:hypothetical protein